MANTHLFILVMLVTMANTHLLITQEHSVESLTCQAVTDSWHKALATPYNTCTHSVENKFAHALNQLIVLGSHA